MTALAGWENFYVIVGSSAGALKEVNPWLVSSTSLHPAFFQYASIMKGLGRSSCFAFRGSKWCARPVTLRIQALI
jgi:hypothetical protein